MVIEKLVRTYRYSPLLKKSKGNPYQNIYFSRFYFKHQDRLPQSQESKKSFSLLNSRKKEEKVNWPHHWKDNGQICQFLSPDKNTWTRPRPSTISFQVELKMCIYYELYCCTSYGNWNLYQHVVPFRTTHICKSKAEYIRKFDEGAVFGNFAQEVFQLEHYEDREIIAPVQ